MFLTIITPTYNRAHTLERCYRSLVDQTMKSFEWIVVDDGSTDETEALIQRFRHESILTIKYIKQENGGKHRAHNCGVNCAVGDLCICLDSDDALSPDAVEVAYKLWTMNSNERIIGILAKRGNFTDHQPICGSWPTGLAADTMLHLQQAHHFSGDTALFFSSTLLKAHLFQEFRDEKFLPEDSLYFQLDRYGKMLLCDKVLYYCEYLEDGLTAKYLTLLRANPLGTSYAYYQRAIHGISLKNKLHDMIVSKAYLQLSRKSSYYAMEQEKLLQKIALMVAPIYVRMKIKG